MNGLGLEDPLNRSNCRAASPVPPYPQRVMSRSRGCSIMERSCVQAGGGLVLAKRFEIHVRGEVPPDLLDELEHMTAVEVPAETVLRGVLPDQSALFGVLARLQNLGLELIEVRRLGDV